MKSFFHYDINTLSEAQKTAFRNAHPSPSEYKLSSFKKDVVPWLDEKYGADLDTSGKKALRIKPNGHRRSADILLVAPYKRYTEYWNEQQRTFIEGVLFLTSGGTEIINYPEQHSENMTAKHQATSQWFKPTVRIYKNMRTRMVEKG